MKLFKAEAHECMGCDFCRLFVKCEFLEILTERRGREFCVGCGACVAACPYEARRLVELSADELKNVREVTVKIDGEEYSVPERITVLKALEMAGYRISSFPAWGDEKTIFAPCGTGGCFSCAVIIDGELKQSCITPVQEGMEIVAERSEIERQLPLRIVSSFQGHAAGGVGTPYHLKPKTFLKAIEVACFAHGCILRCPTCQNWTAVYSSVDEPLTPLQAAKLLTYERRRYRVDRLTISGGESTLNRRWLVSFLKALKKLNKDEKARLHVDTNAVILTEDYIDELYEAGMTDVGPDVKGLRLDTFMKITGMKDKEIARKLKETGWRAVKYLLDEYFDKIFVGVGIPYNPAIISLEEIYRMGEKLAGWEPSVQVCVLDYRPEFRRRDIKKPNYEEMLKVKGILEESGLKCVICQTEFGFVGP